jgi:hypothetical protein
VRLPNFNKSHFLRGLFIVLVVANVLQWIIIFNQARLHRSVVSRQSPETEASAYSFDTGNFTNLKREAITRAALYNSLIESQMLSQGMVVNARMDIETRSIRKTDHCDSLLFSSLRFRSLKALGFEQDAAKAWKKITLSQSHGQWYRHPLCKNKPLSRDMFMGLMIAFEGRPSHIEIHLKETLAVIERGRGFLSNGPFYVSYLSPGPAGLLRSLAEKYQIPFDEWPWTLKQSFSSVEFDALFLRPGYESHLAGLSLWLEHRLHGSQKNYNPRSLLGQIEKSVGLASKSRKAIDYQRMGWIATKLSQENPQNLFFAVLRNRFDGAENHETRTRMLESLLAMPQFPKDRLPNDCDRKADYLWQRSDSEYKARSPQCGHNLYGGVDFMWLTALLVGDL